MHRVPFGTSCVISLSPALLEFKIREGMCNINDPTVGIFQHGSAKRDKNCVAFVRRVAEEDTETSRLLLGAETDARGWL